ncbi:MAG: hypothetical protein ABF975_01395 [Liquorilactobacillus hordei]|uniref:hypothetical protein n=1 Tax=Liquorilactobacillus hordei TaxID=468911 RepID=UPI0039EB8CE7
MKMKIVKPFFRVIEVLIFVGTSLYTGFKYGAELGIFVFGVMATSFVFLNLELFKSVGFGAFKAEFLETKEQVDQLNEFILVYLKNELKSLGEGLNVAPINNGEKKIEFKTRFNYDPFKRVYDLYKAVGSKSDRELKNMIFDKQKQILQEYIAIFNQIIQSYLNYYPDGFKESEDDINRIPQLKHINDIIKEFSRTRKIDFKALDACYQELLKLDGDKAYLTLNWDKCIKSIKDITE